jgi:riboflavin biosynthesis pyrimidine reductase
MKLQCLYERPGLPSLGIPHALAEAYGGDLGFEQPRVVANFVASVDGVVALPGDAESGGLISQGSEADRFVMGLLRACAGAVLVGAGTFRKGEGLWDAESIYPQGAEAFAALRKALALPPRPLFAVVTDSGELDLSHPALQQQALIVTMPRGQSRLGRVPSGAKVLVSPHSRVDLATALATLRTDGAQLVLCEGGPTLVGQLVGEGLLDEFFLTRSPRLFGRRRGDDRKALLEGVDFGQGGGRALDLLSLRQHASYLFLRYAVPRRG